MLIEPTNVWGNPDVWIPVAGITGGIAGTLFLLLLMLLFIFFVSRNSSAYHPMPFPKKSVISLAFIIPSLAVLSALMSVQGGSEEANVYVQFSEASETIYGFPVSRDATDLLLDGRPADILVAGGPEGVRETFGTVTLTLPEGDLPVTLSWAGTEWVFLTNLDNMTEAERLN